MSVPSGAVKRIEVHGGSVASRRLAGGRNRILRREASWGKGLGSWRGSRETEAQSADADRGRSSWRARARLTRGANPRIGRNCALFVRFISGPSTGVLGHPPRRSTRLGAPSHEFDCIQAAPTTSSDISAVSLTPLSAPADSRRPHLPYARVRAAHSCCRLLISALLKWGNYRHGCRRRFTTTPCFSARRRRRCQARNVVVVDI